jgi:Asp/Glu/hydantoin racemase
VVALTEASLLAAMTVGERIGLVIWGKGAAALHHEVIDSYGFAGRICGTRRLDFSPPETTRDADELDAATVEASRALVDQHEADVVLLLGAMFSGRSFLIEEQVDAPVLDGVRCAVPLLEAMVRIRPKRSVGGSYVLPRGRECCGLSPDLERHLSGADGVSRERELGE